MLIDYNRIIVESGRLAFSDIRRIFNVDGTIKPPHEWDPGMAAVAAIETRELFAEEEQGTRLVGLVHKIKLWDKGAALERLMRHLGMFQKDASQPNPNSALSDEELVRKFQMLCDRLGMSVPGAGAAEPWLTCPNSNITGQTTSDQAALRAFR